MLPTEQSPRNTNMTRLAACSARLARWPLSTHSDSPRNFRMMKPALPTTASDITTQKPDGGSPEIRFPTLLFARNLKLVGSSVRLSMNVTSIPLERIAFMVLTSLDYTLSSEEITAAVQVEQ